MIDKELLKTTEKQRMNKIKCRYRHKSLELVHVFSKKKKYNFVMFYYHKVKECQTGYGKCRDGIHCFPLTSLCDGRVTHCSDGSDEDEEFCRGKYRS